MWRAQPIRGTGEHDAGASEPVAEDAELPGSVGRRNRVAKFADLKALTHKVRVFETDVAVTTIQTARTVFEAYGDYNGSAITTKAGSRGAALARWRHLAVKSED